jgi:hypothetical protein
MNSLMLLARCAPPQIKKSKDFIFETSLRSAAGEGHATAPGAMPLARCAPWQHFKDEFFGSGSSLRSAAGEQRETRIGAAV